MENDVVFAKEVDQLHIRIDPPVFPSVWIPLIHKMLSCEGDIADRSIEPDVENLVLRLLQRNRYSPFQVAGNRPCRQPFTNDPPGEVSDIVTPALTGFEPLFQTFFVAIQPEEPMAGRNDLRCSLAHGTFRILQFFLFVGLATGITLVTPCSLCTTMRTGSFHVSVWKKSLTGITEELLGHLLFDVATFENLAEKLLGEFRMAFAGGSPAVVVEGDPQ